MGGNWDLSEFGGNGSAVHRSIRPGREAWACDAWVPVSAPLYESRPAGPSHKQAHFGWCAGPVMWILTKESRRHHNGSRRGSSTEHANRPDFVTLPAY